MDPPFQRSPSGWGVIDIQQLHTLGLQTRRFLYNPEIDIGIFIFVREHSEENISPHGSGCIGTRTNSLSCSREDDRPGQEAASASVADVDRGEDWGERCRQEGRARKRTIFVAFRGSSSLTNALTDLNIARIKVPSDRFRPRCKGVTEQVNHVFVVVWDLGREGKRSEKQTCFLLYSTFP